MMIKGKKKHYAKHNHIAIDGYIFKVKASADKESITLKRVDELENPDRHPISKIKNSLYEFVINHLKPRIS